jgi:hypothetical protein
MLKKKEKKIKIKVSVTIPRMDLTFVPEVVEVESRDPSVR